MKRDQYWNLFWMSGMPEVWMMTRAMEGDLRPFGLPSGGEPDRRSDLPEEARELYQKSME